MNEQSKISKSTTSTKRTKSVLEQLQETEVRCSAIIENSSAGYFRINSKGLYKQVNKAWLTMHGYNAPNEVIGKHFSITQTETGQLEAEKIITELFKITIPQQGEFLRRNKDGSIGYHTYSIHAVKNDDEEVEIEGFLIDTTENKKLNSLVNRLASFPELNPNPVIEINRNGDVLLANEAVRQTKAGNVEPQQFFSADMNEFIKQANPEHKIQYEVIINGRYFETTMHHVSAYDTFRIYAVDITERKTISQQLQESEHKYQLLFENMTAAFALHKMIYDDAGNPVDYQFIELNPAFEKLTGARASDLIGKTVKEVMPHTEQYWIDTYANVVQTGEPISYQNYAKEIGRHYDVWAFSPDKGYFATVFNDITDRVKSEQQIKDSEERFRLVIQASNDGIWDWDMKTNDVFYSRRWKEMLGYNYHELENNFSTWEQLIHPEDRIIVQQKTNEHLINHSPINHVSRFYHKDGSIRWIKANSFALLDDDGTPYRMIGNHTDITEQIQAEEILIQKEILLKQQNEEYLSLNEELNESNIRILKMVEELNTAKENLLENERILKAQNEEYHAINEEYHAINEELSESNLRSQQVNAELIMAKLKAEENEERYQIIFENSGTSNSIFDTNCCLVLQNSFSMKLLGASSLQENVGKSVVEIFGPVQGAAIEKGMRRIMANGIAETTEREFNLPSGTKWFQTSTQPLLDNQKNIIGVQSISTDITQRRLAEDKLRKSEAELKKAQKVARIGNWQWNIKTNQLDWSDEMFALYGIDKNNFSGNLSDIISNAIHPNDKAAVEQSNLSVIHSKQPTPMEYRVVWPDQSIHYIWAEAGELLTDKDGNPEILTGIAQDITERKKITNELILAKELAEESDRLKSAFLANMSHEIRTPMNAIMGFAEIIEDPTLTFDKRQKFISIIRQRCNDLLNILNDILDISKIEAGQLNIHETEGDLSMIFSEISVFFEWKKVIDNKALELTNKIQLIDNQALVKTDFGRIKQVLMNLLGNALKFTHAGSIELGCSIMDGNLLFYVKDTGIGIPKNKHDVVFERFRQADEHQTTRIYGGTGLGLSISKGLIELMNGKIWMTSEEQKGSTFFFTIPYKPASVKLFNEFSTKIMTSYVEYNWHHKTILIVEDEPTNMVYLQEVLNGTKANLLIAYNGEAALKLFSENKNTIDIVLMDVRLPDANGFQLTQTMKAERKEIVIVAQTAYASEEDKIKSIEAGCDNYITKPLRRDHLFKMIDGYFK